MLARPPVFSVGANVMESTGPQLGPDAQGPPTLARRRLGPLGSGVLSLLLVLSLFAVPIFGFLIAPMAIVPILHFQTTSSRPSLAWSWVVVLLAIASVSGFGEVALPVLLAYLLIVVLPALSVRFFEGFDWDEGRWVAVSTGIATLCSIIVVVALTAPLTPMEGVAEWIRAAGEQGEELYGSMGMSRGELELALDAAEKYASWVMPVFPIGYFIIVLFWIRPRLLVLGARVRTGKFEDYRSEEWLPAAFALAGLGTLLLNGTAKWVAINVLFAVLILYFVHGLAIIRAHLARWVGRGWLVRWGVTLICLQMPFPPLVIILGVTDSFRSLRPRADDDGGIS